MTHRSQLLLLWSPRLLGIVVCLFLSLFALDAFQEALRIRPNDPTALYNSGVAYHFQNRPDKVKETYASLRTRDPRAAEEFAGRYLKR